MIFFGLVIVTLLVSDVFVSHMNSLLEMDCCHHVFWVGIGIGAAVNESFEARGQTNFEWVLSHIFPYTKLFSL